MSKIKNIIISVILSFCMVTASLPVELLAQESVEAGETESRTEESAESSDKARYEIISFGGLPEEVIQQNVAIGTPVEDLQLPDSLTVSYISLAGSKVPEDEKQQEKDKTDTETGKEEPEDETGNDPETENSEKEPDNESDEGKSETEPEEEKPETGSGEEEPEDETENGSDIENGENDPETDPEIESSEPEINESETESEKTQTEESTKTDSNEAEIRNEEKPASEAEIAQKTVTVHMKEYRSEPDYTIETVNITMIEVITWISTPEYDADTEGIYVFTPILPEEYILKDGVKIPEITVTVDEIEEAYSLEDESDLPEEETILETISTDTEWGETLLTDDGTIILENDATLKLKGTVTIEGNITIKGGGKIVREDNYAYFKISSTEGSLTLYDITVDGNYFGKTWTMINASNGGTITLAGCTIMNCTIPDGSSGSGSGFISMSIGKVDIDNTTITNCSSVSGGAIDMFKCTADIKNTVFTDCAASSEGGAVDISYSRRRLYYGGS